MDIKCIKCGKVAHHGTMKGRLRCKSCRTYICFDCGGTEKKCPQCKRRLTSDELWVIFWVITMLVVVGLISYSFTYFILTDPDYDCLEENSVGEETGIIGRIWTENRTSVFGVETDNENVWNFNKSIYLNRLDVNVEIKLNNNTKITSNSLSDIIKINGTEKHRFAYRHYVRVSGIVRADENGSKYLEVTEIESETATHLILWEYFYYVVGIAGLFGIIILSLPLIPAIFNIRSHKKNYRKAVSEGKVQTFMKPESSRSGRLIIESRNEERRNVIQCFIILVITSLFLISISYFINIFYYVLPAYLIIFLAFIITLGFHLNIRNRPRSIGIDRDAIDVEYLKKPKPFGVDIERPISPLEYVRWDEIESIQFPSFTSLKFKLKDGGFRSLECLDHSVGKKIVHTYLKRKKLFEKYREGWGEKIHFEGVPINWKHVDNVEEKSNRRKKYTDKMTIIFGVILSSGFGLLFLWVFPWEGLIISISVILFGVSVLLIIPLIHPFFRGGKSKVDRLGNRRIGISKGHLFLKMKGEYVEEIFPRHLPRDSIKNITFEKDKLLIETTIGLVYILHLVSKQTADWIIKEWDEVNPTPEFESP